ncbi:MAG: hypothetical protein EA353_00990 [Puniceicoccaceae bacterium]|nr:MAG: hypothetical protein EA353_00990 [Puniceicoccaceae bacterium]
MNLYPIFSVKLILNSLLGGCLLLAPLSAAPENFRIEKDPTQPTQPLKLKWWGNPGHYYVVESSIDLVDWNYYIYAVKGVAGDEGLGQAEALQLSLSVGTNKAFFRLQGDDDPLSVLGLTDHDGDGISTALELDAGMNPLVPEEIVDSNSNGLPDYWELFYFGDLSRDGEGDFDGDGILDKYEWQFRTNPASDQASEHPPQTTGRIDFTYDALGRIVTASGPISLTYAFDDEGNLNSAN